MKFAVAVVMFVCAFAVAQASWAAIAPGVSYVNSVAHGPALGLGLWGGHGAWWNGAPAAVAAPWNGNGWNAWNGAAAPWGLTGHGWSGAAIPGIGLSQGPAGHEGVYVAKTRGAIHTAPLAGHINSATSVNVAPAPGTL
ncbi:adult cuticle protein 1 [Drosophila tropicalis]|uniref:adult cuticle protein 1 n=1 Tax=Drosophila tropicalis TaxID=46794 RepID=UPI0035AB885D